MPFPKVIVGVSGDTGALPAEDQDILRVCLQGAADMINNADHEKIDRQYRAGRLSTSTGFDWYMDQTPVVSE